eukprot:1787610-Rhodomonas_salina.6
MLQDVSLHRSSPWEPREKSQHGREKSPHGIRPVASLGRRDQSGHGLEVAAGRSTAQPSHSPLPGLQDMLNHCTMLETWYENRYASLERYMAFLVMFHAMADRVAAFLPLKFDTSRSQSQLRVATTAAPISAVDIQHEWADSPTRVLEHFLEMAEIRDDDNDNTANNNNNNNNTAATGEQSSTEAPALVVGASSGPVARVENADNEAEGAMRLEADVCRVGPLVQSSSERVVLSASC